MTGRLTLTPRDSFCVDRTSASLPFALRGWETAPRTAIWVHFQLFCHKFVIGPLGPDRGDWALIGCLVPGLCSDYVTATQSRDWRPPCWIVSQQSLQTNQTESENLPSNIHLTWAPTTTFRAKVRQSSQCDNGEMGVDKRENLSE